MYNVNKPNKSLIYKSYELEGETIENKIRRIVNNGEPITDGSPTIFTERKDGVLPEYNPRTDKWDIAIDAMDKISKSKLAKRTEKPEMKAIKGGSEGEKDGGAEPIQGTSKTD